jgi:predicted small lipoprotein YifL
MLKQIGILGGTAPAGTQPAAQKAFGPTGLIVIGSWILAVAMLTGCGQKGPLYLPQPDQMPPKSRNAATSAPTSTPGGEVLRGIPSN